MNDNLHPIATPEGLRRRARSMPKSMAAVQAALYAAADQVDSKDAEIARLKKELVRMDSEPSSVS